MELLHEFQLWGKGLGPSSTMHNKYAFSYVLNEITEFAESKIVQLKCMYWAILQQYAISYETLRKNARGSTQYRLSIVSNLVKKVQNSELFYEIAYYPEMRSMGRSLRMIGNLHKHCDRPLFCALFEVYRCWKAQISWNIQLSCFEKLFESRWQFVVVVMVGFHLTK